MLGERIVGDAKWVQPSAPMTSAQNMQEGQYNNDLIRALQLNNTGDSAIPCNIARLHQGEKMQGGSMLTFPGCSILSAPTPRKKYGTIRDPQFPPQQSVGPMSSAYCNLTSLIISASPASLGEYDATITRSVKRTTPTKVIRNDILYTGETRAPVVYCTVLFILRVGVPALQTQ